MDNERPECLRYDVPAGKKTDNNNNTVENAFGPLSFVYQRVEKLKPQERKKKLGEG